MESTSTATGGNDIASLQNDEDRFLVSYRLLSRWQNQLEYFLYQFCKTHAPQLLVDCHWSCPEAAELTQLTEKFTEFFCFHNKPVFRNHGVSEEERETFCTKLQRVRRIRNFAVHRVNPSVHTIRKYANDALDVLRIVQRLGNEVFRRSFESPLNELIQTFWEIDNDGRMASQNHSLVQAKQESIQVLSKNEQKEVNLKRGLEDQKIAAQRKAFNIAKAAEDFEISKMAKDVRLRRVEQQEEEAGRKKIERAERFKKQEEDAAARKAERAEKARMQEENAEAKRAEKTEKVKNQEGNAEIESAEKAEELRKQEENAEAKRTEEARKQEKNEQAQKAEKAEEIKKHHEDAEAKRAEKARKPIKQEVNAKAKRAQKAEKAKKKKNAESQRAERDRSKN